MAGKLGNREAACSCLNGNGPHKLICLEIWSPGSRAGWLKGLQGLGGVGVL